MADECYPPPPHSPPDIGAGISELFSSYKDLGKGGKQSWKGLADDVTNVAKSHSYARILQEARYADAYENAVAAAVRQRDGDLSPDVYEDMQQQLDYNRIDGPTGAGVVTTGPGLVSHLDYLTDHPNTISPYERWVLNRNAVFVNRNKIPRMLDPVEEQMCEGGGGGMVAKEEITGLWTETAEKRNTLINERNKWCEAYNKMVEECQIAIGEVTRDKASFFTQQTDTLVRMINHREYSDVRKSLLASIAELHEKINDEQFEIFKCEAMMQEINAITVQGLAESDIVNRAKKLLIDAGMPSAFLRYCKGLASQKTDMYEEYKERILVASEVADRVVAPMVEAWHKASRLIKPAIALTKSAVAQLSPGCPLYPVIRNELKKANVDYKDEPDSLAHLGRDDNPYMIMAEVDSIFAFMEQMGTYLLNEASLLTANLETAEIIRSWKDRPRSVAKAGDE